MTIELAVVCVALCVAAHAALNSLHRAAIRRERERYLREIGELEAPLKRYTSSLDAARNAALSWKERA